MNLMEHLNSFLSGPTSSIPAPAPSCVDDLSTYIDQMFVCVSIAIGWSLLPGADCCSVSWDFRKAHSATKSASAWAFIDVFGHNSKPYSLSSMFHLTI